MRWLARLVGEASRRRIGPQTTLYRLEPESDAGAWRRVSMQAVIATHARVVPLSYATDPARLPRGTAACYALRQPNASTPVTQAGALARDCDALPVLTRRAT